VIKDIQANSRVDDTFLLADSKLMSFNNKPGQYLAVRLMDHSGVIDGRVWERGEAILNSLNGSKVVRVTAVAQEFKGQLQLNIQSLTAATGEPSDYMMQAQNAKENKVFLSKKIAQISELSTSADALINAIFKKVPLRDFLRAPAATKYHHAVIGGLTEHTLNVVNNVENMLKLYPNADAEIALLGALLHDIGKAKELSYDFAFDYTVEGNLLGHILIGCILVKESIEDVRKTSIDFPKEKEILLLHMIASHHGRLEWGSPQTPKTIEAAILHHCDLIDAQVNMFQSVEGEPGTCVYSPLLQRGVYIKQRH